MGGYGSGWHRPRKTTVGACWIIDAGRLQREGALRSGLHAKVEQKWLDSDGETVAAIGMEVKTCSAEPFMRLHYSTKQGDDVRHFDYMVRLVTVPLPWGNVRWEFRCPNCRRKCRRLYLPPYRYRFACRLCWDLTYVTAQEAHRFDAVFARMGMTPQQGRWLEKCWEQQRKDEEKRRQQKGRK